jgi:hypothetical protein
MSKYCTMQQWPNTRPFQLDDRTQCLVEQMQSHYQFAIGASLDSFPANFSTSNRNLIQKINFLLESNI